jgi:hypothetical protein
MTMPQPPGRQATREDITRILGELDEARIAAILATGASAAELEEAAAWMAGESDMMGAELERPLAGVVARVCEILATDEELPEDRA